MNKKKQTRYGWTKKNWELKDDDVQETIDHPVISKYPIKDLLTRVKITMEEI